MQIVPDANVLVSAAVTPEGVCRTLLDALERSPLDIVVSPLLLMEVDRVLQRPRLETAGDPAPWVPPPRVWARPHRGGRTSGSPAARRGGPRRRLSRRLVLAAPDRILVTGDPHLLALAGTYPVVDPRTLLDRIRAAARHRR